MNTADRRDLAVCVQCKNTWKKIAVQSCWVRVTLRKLRSERHYTSRGNKAEEAPAVFQETGNTTVMNLPAAWIQLAHRWLTDTGTVGHQQVHLPFTAVVRAGVAPGHND